MIGIVITIYNRPEYLFHCFESLKNADLSNCILVIIDDFSQDKKTIELIEQFSIPSVEVIKHRMAARVGVRVCIRQGIDMVFHKCDHLMVLDGDTMVRKDFVEKIMRLPQNGISTGFHSTVNNRDGSVRHPIIFEIEQFYLKKIIGGVNMAFSKDIYLKYVEPALLLPGNWDTNACHKLAADGKRIYSLKESVIQHLGINSAMGHSGGNAVEKADESDTFYLHDLKNVTLVGVGSDHDAIKRSIDKCTKYIRWGQVKIFSNIGKGKHLLNQFVFKQLSYHIDTEYFLIVQADSWILNPSAWDDTFFEYDYIGNDGFCFRSKKFARILHQDQNIVLQNDHEANICEIYRKYLEDSYKIKFASKEITDRFVIENWSAKPPANKYNGSFGFHGFGNIDYTDSYITPPTP